MAHEASHLTVSIDIMCRCVGSSFFEYDPPLPLYQCGYQSIPQHVKLKDIHLLLWNPSNVNDGSILMDNLYCLLNVLPFDGSTVVCDPKCHTGYFNDCLDHGEESTEFCIDPSVVSIMLQLFSHDLIITLLHL